MKFIIIFVFTLVSANAVHQNKTIKKEGRILNGEKAFPAQYPWQVYLVIDDNRQCGGSVVSNEFILTAAHCVVDSEYGEVRLGSVNSEKAFITREFNRSDVTVHPDYDRKNLFNDIALIDVEYFEFSCLIKPVELFTEDIDIDSEATVTGWGITFDGSDYYPDELQAATVKIIENSYCEKQFNVASSIICTWDDRSFCVGDGGGPLVVYETNKQVGIVSLINNYHCGNDVPNVYTRVSEYVEWINSVIQKKKFNLGLVTKLVNL